jgi:hypothetical protein
MVGNVVSIQPRILPGGQAIYTEYRLSVSSVLLNRTSWKQTIPATCELIELGGAVQLPNGSVSRHLVSGLGTPLATGVEYLLFLKYYQAAQAFRPIKLWNLTGGIAKAMATDDIVNAQKGLSAVDGKPVSSILTNLNSLISH